MNAKITRFTQTVSFVGNNQIITASGIQNISTCLTMNELSTNNDLNKLNFLSHFIKISVWFSEIPHLAQCWLVIMIKKNGRSVLKIKEFVQLSAMIYLKACNCLPHNLLLAKLNILDTSSVENIKFYLSRWKQINKTFSK